MPIRTKQIIRPRTTGVTLGVWLRMQSSLEKAAWFAGRGSRLTQYFQKQDRRLVHVQKLAEEGISGRQPLRASGQSVAHSGRESIYLALMVTVKLLLELLVSFL